MCLLCISVPRRNPSELNPSELSSECVRLAYCHTVFAHPVASPNSHQKKKKGPI